MLWSLTMQRSRHVQHAGMHTCCRFIHMLHMWFVTSLSSYILFYTTNFWTYFILIYSFVSFFFCMQTLTYKQVISNGWSKASHHRGGAFRAWILNDAAFCWCKMLRQLWLVDTFHLANHGWRCIFLRPKKKTRQHLKLQPSLPLLAITN